MGCFPLLVKGRKRLPNYQHLQYMTSVPRNRFEIFIDTHILPPVLSSGGCRLDDDYWERILFHVFDVGGPCDPSYNHALTMWDRTLDVRDAVWTKVVAAWFEMIKAFEERMSRSTRRCRKVWIMVLSQPSATCAKLCAWSVQVGSSKSSSMPRITASTCAAMTTRDHATVSSKYGSPTWNTQSKFSFSPRSNTNSYSPPPAYETVLPSADPACQPPSPTPSPPPRQTSPRRSALCHTSKLREKEYSAATMLRSTLTKLGYTAVAKGARTSVPTSNAKSVRFSVYADVVVFTKPAWEQQQQLREQQQQQQSHLIYASNQDVMDIHFKVHRPRPRLHPHARYVAMQAQRSGPFNAPIAC